MAGGKDENQGSLCGEGSALEMAMNVRRFTRGAMAVF